MYSFSLAMTDANRGEITLLLDRWRSGDPAAFDSLVPVVYNDLRRLAQSMMRRERSDHTLQATALLNETYMRLVKQRKVALEDRSQKHYGDSPKHTPRFRWRTLLSHDALPEGLRPPCLEDQAALGASHH